MSEEQPSQKMSDDLFGVPAYEALPPTQRPFFPWHRPRKQYVRSEQWSIQIEKLFDDLGESGKALRYLGLPGSDLLDLRYFHAKVCAPREIPLLFLGFNSDAKEDSPGSVDQNISLDQVRKLPFVDPRSLILPDDIRSLANSDSLGSKHAETLGPYDVINLDLCDGFAKKSPDAEGWSHYEALGKLLALQFRNKSPWLLLLTTRTGSDHVHQEFLQKLVEKYKSNLTACEEFRNESGEKFGIGDHDALENALADQSQSLPVFLTGLCKWIVGMAIANSPPSSTEVKSVMGYRVVEDSPCEDIVSLAIRFAPQMSTVFDPAGVLKPAANLPNECKLSVQALRRVAKRKDADHELDSNDELRKDMVQGMADLLSDARYDRASFEQWVLAVEGWQAQ